MATKNITLTFDSPFDTYTVDGMLGEGGNGRVYAVVNAANERFALKCLSPERTSSEKRKRFKNEIAFCSKNTHKNIVNVIDYGLSISNSIKCPFYVMPVFPKTLRSLMHDKIPAEKVLDLFCQILDGVEAAHKLNAFHRDLKPENILYDPKANLAVVADFGIAHFERDALETFVETRLDSKMANFGYAAPEQKTKGQIVDHRADIFALGQILNEMFTGEIPHGAGYALISASAPQFAYLDKLVESMIQNKPNNRPESVDAIKRELISRGNEFVVRQQIDRLQNQVVPITQANSFVPLEISGFDWENGVLKITLNRIPEPRWIRNFNNPTGSWESYVGSEPQRFQFSGLKVTVGVDADLAQRVLVLSKKYVEMANTSYQQEIESEAKINEQRIREGLKRSQQEAEKRLSVVSALKL